MQPCAFAWLTLRCLCDPTSSKLSLGCKEAHLCQSPLRTLPARVPSLALSSDESLHSAGGGGLLGRCVSGNRTALLASLLISTTAAYKGGSFIKDLGLPLQSLEASFHQA